MSYLCIPYLYLSQMNRKDYEIMAPVGSYESLMAAINAGADSIYFGIEGLNMRSKSANNFTTEDLYKIAAICREHDVKSYLTVNTIIYDEDLELMRKIIDSAKDADVSAIIAADVAPMLYARSIGVEVHLSTQLNITNVEALRFYAQFADVVVLARELNMDQVAAIHKAIVEEPIVGPAGEPIRIEMFAHGALCMAVSGKCYLSLHEQGKSANRGSCSQICRRSYEVKDKETGIELEIDNQYIMSPKDLKTIHFLNKMLDAGGDRSGLGSIDDFAHQAQVFVIDNGIDREVALHAVVTADRGNLMEVFGGEVVGTLGAHIEAFDTEVDGVCACVDGCHQGLIGAHRCHYFVIFAVHL